MAAKKIEKGKIFTAENLAVKRPGIGISPIRWDEIVGQYAERDYKTCLLYTSDAADE